MLFFDESHAYPLALVSPAKSSLKLRLARCPLILNGVTGPALAGRPQAYEASRA